MTTAPNILVVGAGFGANYAHAIAADSRLSLAGIVGRGGAFGQHLAAQLHCPYYDSLEQALSQEHPQAAVVAVRGQIVGGEGDNLSRILLSARVPVLQELPIHSQDLLTTLRTAKQHNTPFAINPFYDRLPALQQLAQTINYLRRQTVLRSIELRTTIQTFLQSQLVLAAILKQPPTHTLSIHAMAGQHKRLISSRWGEIDVDTLLQHRLNPAHPDDASQPLMGFTCTTDDGELFLPNPWSAIVWERRLQQVADHRGKIDYHPDHTILQCSRTEAINPVQMLHKHIYPAIQDTIHSFLSTPPELQRQQRQLAVLRYAESITHEIGPPTATTWQPPLALLPLQPCSESTR